MIGAKKNPTRFLTYGSVWTETNKENKEGHLMA